MRSRRQAEERRQPSRPAQLLLGGYLALLLALTFFPFSQLDEDSGGGGKTLNLRPFATISGALEAGTGSYRFALLVGNVAAFMPLGVLLPLAIGRRRAPWLVLAAGLSLSAGIEVGQYAASTRLTFLSRQADVDDVIVNTVGALLGYAAYRVALMRAVQ